MCESASSPLRALITIETKTWIRQRHELMQPMMFFVIVVTLFPLAITPDPVTLQRLAPGIFWVGTLLSLLLGLDKCFRDDYQFGMLEQYQLLSLPFPLIVNIKVLIFWLATLLPLLAISPLLAVFLNLTLDMYVALLATILIGTPIIAWLGSVAVALTLGVNKSGALVFLLLLPLLIPLLIFATSAVNAAALEMSYWPQLAIIGAILLVVLASAPFALSYALKLSQ